MEKRLTREQLAAELLHQHRSFANFVASLDQNRYAYAPPGKWNAGAQLDHLIRSVRPLVLAYRLPVWLPGLLFGPSKNGSAAFADIARRYEAQLKAGAKATGAYIPKGIPFADRQRGLEALLEAAERVAGMIRRMPEATLDRYRLPHPLIGKLSYREMAYFTIHHVGHHEASLRLLSGM
jgi:hypothetical protein